MASEYAKLLINLEANTAKFTGAMNDASNKISSFQSGIKKMAGVFAGVFAVGRIYDYVRSVANAADSQRELARRLGATKADVDALTVSFQKGGQSVQSSEKSLDIFNRKIGELQSGSKAAADAFALVGLNAGDLAGKSYTERLIAVKNGLDGMTTSARAFASQQLFGRGGAKIYEGLQALEETNKMIKEINERLGIDSVDSIDQMNDSFVDTQKKLSLITEAIIVNLAPAIEDAAIAAGKLAMNLVEVINAQGKVSANNTGWFGGRIASIGKGWEIGTSGPGSIGGVTGGIMGALAGLFDPNTINEHFENMLKQAEQGRGVSAPSTLQQITGKSDFEAGKKAEEDAMKTAEQQAQLAESFASLYKTLSGMSRKTETKKWIDALSKYQEGRQDLAGFAESVTKEMQSPFEKYIEYTSKLDTALQSGMITADTYWKALTGAFADLQNSAGMQYMQGMEQSMLRMGQLVPSSGVQIMDIGASRFSAPGQAASMSASEAASMMGGGLEDINRQQLTAQKNIEAGINQVAFLLARGLI